MPDLLAERVGLTRPFRPRPTGACGVQNANAFCRTHGFELHKSCGNKKAPSRGLLLLLAERVGFEPTVRETVHLISNQAHSTTLAPLHWSNLFLKQASCGRQYT